MIDRPLALTRGFDMPENYDEGRTGDSAPIEERQRLPGDYDAMVGQRPIAIHALEHLATTDRGTIMVRNTIRQGIHDVQNGRDPKGLIREGSHDPSPPTPPYIRTVIDDLLQRHYMAPATGPDP